MNFRACLRKLVMRRLARRSARGLYGFIVRRLPPPPPDEVLESMGAVDEDPPVTPARARPAEVPAPLPPIGMVPPRVWAARTAACCRRRAGVYAEPLPPAASVADWMLPRVALTAPPTAPVIA